MLTFLRKIRRSLVESGKTGRYLLYALGEITLVVIGILIALQINNWNEGRKARIIEIDSLISLKEEFQKNQIDLQEHILWKQEAQSKWDTFLITISNQELPPEKRAVRRPIATYVNFIISNSILNSLLATGRIDNLQNDSLKYMITTWQDVVNDYLQFQEMHSDFVNNELMSFENTLFQDESNARYGFNYPFPNSNKKAQLYLKAYDSMVYQNILLRNFYWINIQIRRIKILEEKMNQIVQLLDKEIALKKKVMF